MKAPDDGPLSILSWSSSEEQFGKDGSQWCDAYQGLYRRIDVLREIG